jgi:ribosomal protein S18 acetylase RimI-like enzyme
MEIRHVNSQDLKAIMNLIRSCANHMEAKEIHQWDEIYPDESTIKNDIDKLQLYLLEDAEHVCGIIAMNEDQQPEYKNVSWKFPGKTLVVHRLAIEPSCQRKGYARMLMQFAHKLAKERHYENIRLDAFIHNPAAVALYEKLGYRKAGILTFRKGDFFCFEISVDSLKV